MFIWLCLPSLRCLVSTLTQAGGGGLLLRFTSSVQSCCGEAGALQTDIAVCGERSPCSGHTGFAPHRGVCAFPVCTAQAPGCSIWSGPCAECVSSFWVLHNSTDSVVPAFCAFPGLRGSGSQRLGRPLPRCSVISCFKIHLYSLSFQFVHYYRHVIFHCRYTDCKFF